MTEFATLAVTRCDFCAEKFTPPRWNCRTCHRCAAVGLPDQSAMPWCEYERVLADRRRESGIQHQLSGAARMARENANGGAKPGRSATRTLKPVSNLARALLDR